MAPNVLSNGAVGLGSDSCCGGEQQRGGIDQGEQQAQEKKKAPYKRAIVWRNVILFAYLHAAALYGVFLMLTSAKILTSLWAFVLYLMSGLGITAGAHRLWSHRTYKANLPMRLILAVFNTLAFQNSIWEWARDHRVHHKYSETDADPHDARRGFFFSHIGWLLVRKKTEVIEKGKGLDLSDLEKDPVVMFQKKYYALLMPVTCFVLPTLVPVYLWDETWTNSWFVAALWRYTFALNMTWLVNSAAHMWGNKPYDKTINPSENVSVALGALGEGWHNYHHVFPWDYKAAELGNYRLNLTTGFIDFFAWLGWAWDLKTVSKEVVMRRVARLGDGTHAKHAEHQHQSALWGWGDKDMTIQDRVDTTRFIGTEAELHLQ